MASSTQTLCDQTLNNTAITGNGVFTLFTSATINNSVGLASGRVILDYSSANPSDNGTNTITYAITAVLEGLQDSVWYPVAYQFEPYKGNSANGNQRIMVVQPGIQAFDAGIDDIIWVGDTTIARVSRQQGKLPTALRLKMVCKENGFGGSGAFQSVVVKAMLEMYDALA